MDLKTTDIIYIICGLVLFIIGMYKIITGLF